MPEFKRQYHPRTWADLDQRLTVLFASQSRAHWLDLLEGSDACLTPVLAPKESETHPHMAARAVYAERDGVFQAAPAPRFSSSAVCSMLVLSGVALVVRVA